MMQQMNKDIGKIAMRRMNKAEKKAYVVTGSQTKNDKYDGYESYANSSDNSSVKMNHQALIRTIKRRRAKKQFSKITALEKQIRETDDKDEIRKLKIKISSFQNRLGIRSSTRGIKEKLIARNKCIYDLMKACDSVLTINAKIDIVNALELEHKFTIKEALQSYERQNDK